MSITSVKAQIYFSLLLFLMFFQAPASLQAETQFSSHVSPTQTLKWEVDQIRPEALQPEFSGQTVVLHNAYCPLSRTRIEAPIDRLSKGFVYKGRNKAFKGKTFVFNFCCTSCRERFHKHFAKFPDEILAKFKFDLE